jgi:transposase-like protein
MATHRVYTPDFKLRVVMEIVTGVKKPSEVCREHRLKDSMVLVWRKTFAENAVRIFQTPDRSADAARIAELERVIGRLTVENEILKKASTLLGFRRDGSGS